VTLGTLRAAVICAIGLLTGELPSPRILATRPEPSTALVIPVTTLRSIAVDFDAGRNVIYCFFGTAAEGRLEVRVDSVAVVSGAVACGGIGIGFISRIQDPSTMTEMLRGIIESHPDFRVVSAFYKTEIIEVDGQSVRAAHALSVMRAPGVVRTARTESQRRGMPPPVV